MNGLAFSVQEYRERRGRVRAAMAERSIDVLYVTSPANLQYLTGYEAVWFPPRLPVAVALVRDAEPVVCFDWTRHDGYVRTRVLCDDAVFFQYGQSTSVVLDAFRTRGWLDAAIALEWNSPTPTGAVISELAERLRSAGARIVSGDWVVDGVRLYKSAAELERIRSAAVIADHAFERLREYLRPGLSELEVSAHLGSLLAQEGSEIAATPPLVSAGPEAWTDVHAFPGRRTLELGDVVSIDACGVVDRYHANLSRTYGLGEASTLARELLELAAGAVDELVRVASPGEGPEAAAAAAERHVRERVANKRIWWIGGYALGLGVPPSWVGHTYLANDGPERCEWRPGYVSNFEVILYDEDEGFAAATIDTVLMTATGLEVLSRLPRAMIDIPITA